MQRIFNYGDIQNIDLTQDKELNILIHGMPFCVIKYRNYRLSEIVQFFGPPSRCCVVYCTLQLQLFHLGALEIGHYKALYEFTFFTF